MIRIFDLLFSLFGIVLLSPLLIPISLILLLTGEHKIFYRQQRVGKNGKHFGLLKFATMLENSPNMPGGDITSSHDPRVLPCGKFLRITKINELPQLLNIFLGDLSFVGPRPLTPKNFSFYDDKTQFIIKQIKPGLTGIGSVVFRNEERILAISKKDPIDCYKEDIAPFKGELEKWYFNKQGIFLYLVIICLTAYIVLFPQTKIIWNLFKDLPKPRFEMEIE